MELAPRHRIPLMPAAPWAVCRERCVHAGALWFQDGASGEDLLAWTRSRLNSRWFGKGWSSTLDGIPIQLSPWAALESLLPRFAGIWLGAATFELACDEAELPRKALPLGQLGQSWGLATEALHWQNGVLEVLSWDQEPPDVDGWNRRLDRMEPPQPSPLVPAPLYLTPEWSQEKHREAVLSIQEQILDGSFYVANLCVPFHGKLQTSAEELACRAMHQARPPFGALLHLGDTQLLSLSMERLLARRGEHLWSQPIKGSAGLSGDPKVDQITAQCLAADPKERAEHTMILDLVRNDLGRVALPGSVAVSRCMALEPYPTVLHLVSRVEAQARPGLGLAELLRAVLPGGSVTGAPKHAVCHHLAGAEAAPRNFYCGAMGWISGNGDLDLALPIRTAQISGDQITYWTGGGITRRSDAEREWRELFLKTQAITS